MQAKVLEFELQCSSFINKIGVVVMCVVSEMWWSREFVDTHQSVGAWTPTGGGSLDKGSDRKDSLEKMVQINPADWGDWGDQGEKK